jgi:arginyl-tRNA synthetase
MLDFDVEAAKRHSADNPVYYVQYAHARIASIIKHAQSTGADVSEARQHVFGKFYSESEHRLARVLVNFPEIVLNACKHRAPNFLTAYAEELAAIFHNFYQKNRVVTEDHEVAEHRLALCILTKEIIRKTLNLLGVSAPEKM